MYHTGLILPDGCRGVSGLASIHFRKFSMSKERIQKALARQGVASRRQIESWIQDGHIQINGKPAVLGDQVEAGDVVMIDGRKVVIRDDTQQLPRVIAYNKQEDEITTKSDPQDRPTVFAHLPRLHHGRWVAVGRLDINTTGLILFTDNGELANRLMHPSSEIDREYLVRTMGLASDETLRQLTHGVELEDGPARFEEVNYVGGGQGINHWYTVIIMEGRKREVRRLWEAVGIKVSRLKRVRYGPIALASTHKPGKVKELSAEDVIMLAERVGLNFSMPDVEAEPRQKKTVGLKSSQARRAKEPRRQSDRISTRKVAKKTATTKRATTRRRG